MNEREWVKTGFCWEKRPYQKCPHCERHKFTQMKQLKTRGILPWNREEYISKWSFCSWCKYREEGENETL